MPVAARRQGARCYQGPRRHQEQIVRKHVDEEGLLMLRARPLPFGLVVQLMMDSGPDAARGRSVPSVKIKFSGSLR